MPFFAELPIVISYYTKDTPYETEVLGLINSCKEFGIEHCIEAVPNQGSWEKNCSLKPKFIKDKLLELQRPILWVDADAVFLRPLHFEEWMFSDLSFVKDKTTKDPRFSVRSGTVYINATDKGLLAANLWCEYSEKIWQLEQKCLAFQDQTSLYFTVLSSPPLSIRELPLGYCAIFDEKLDPNEIVIEQRQASRRFHTHKT